MAISFVTSKRQWSECSQEIRYCIPSRMDVFPEPLGPTSTVSGASFSSTSRRHRKFSKRTVRITSSSLAVGRRTCFPGNSLHQGVIICLWLEFASSVRNVGLK